MEAAMSAMTEGWTRCAFDGCPFVAFDGYDLCPDHAVTGGSTPETIKAADGNDPSSPPADVR